jgi:hypothetical protein
MEVGPWRSAPGGRPLEVGPSRSGQDFELERTQLLHPAMGARRMYDAKDRYFGETANGQWSAACRVRFLGRACR